MSTPKMSAISPVIHSVLNTFLTALPESSLTLQATAKINSVKMIVTAFISQ